MKFANISMSIFIRLSNDLEKIYEVILYIFLNRNLFLITR